MKSKKFVLVGHPRLYQTCLAGFSCLATLTALAVINPPQTYVLADDLAVARNRDQTPVKDVTRTIVVVDQSGNELHRTIQSPHQLSSGQSVWPDYFAPEVAGYSPTSKDDLQVASQTIGPQSKDETVKLTFAKDSGQSQSQSKVGVQFEWRLVDAQGQELHQADQMVFAAPGTSVKTPDPLHNSRFVAAVPKSVKVYPGGPQTYQLTVEPVGLGHPTERTVSRQIVLDYPDGSQKAHTDVLHFSKKYEFNNWGKALQLSEWTPQTTWKLPEFVLPKVLGYNAGRQSISSREVPSYYLDHSERLKELNMHLKYRPNPSKKEERTLTRVIILHTPGEPDNRVTQAVKASRMVYQDPFDGSEKGPWAYDGTFPAYQVPIKAGFQAKVDEVPALNPATFPERADSTTVAVDYTPLVTQTTEERTVTRKVIWRVPGRPDTSTTQKVGAVRTVYHHQQKGKLSASAWHFLSDFPELEVPAVAGFHAHLAKVTALKPTEAMVDSEVPAVLVVYEPDIKTKEEAKQQAGGVSQQPTSEARPVQDSVSSLSADRTASATPDRTAVSEGRPAASASSAGVHQTDQPKASAKQVDHQASFAEQVKSLKSGDAVSIEEKPTDSQVANPKDTELSQKSATEDQSVAGGADGLAQTGSRDAASSSGSAVDKSQPSSQAEAPEDGPASTSTIDQATPEVHQHQESVGNNTSESESAASGSVGKARQAVNAQSITDLAQPKKQTKKVIKLPWWQNSSTNDLASQTARRAVNKVTQSNDSLTVYQEIAKPESSTAAVTTSQTQLVDSRATEPPLTDPFQDGNTQAGVPTATDDAAPVTIGADDPQILPGSSAGKSANAGSSASIDVAPAQSSLPQTGNVDNKTTFLGLVVTAIAGLFGFHSFKGKRR